MQAKFVNHRLWNRKVCCHSLNLPGAGLQDARHRLFGSHNDADGRTPCSDTIGRVVNWPIDLKDLAEVVKDMHQEFEGMRAQLLAWGADGSDAPAYALLGAPNAMTYWFIDRVSAATLLGPLDELLSAPLDRDNFRHNHPACFRMRSMLKVLRRIVPGSVIELDGPAHHVGRRILLEVSGMEADNQSHSKCLAMIARSSWTSASSPEGVQPSKSAGPATTALSPASSARPGKRARSAGKV
jgi:hypothetical protein